MRIGIDFDDVVANSLDVLMRLHNERYGTALTRADFHSFNLWEVWGGTREEAIKKIDEFFNEDQLKEISPIAGSIEAINTLKQEGHDLYVITGRAERDVAQTERWLKHHFAGVFKGVHYAHFNTLDKSPRRKLDICKELKIELMIDDHLPTAIECAENGIKAFLFNQPNNAHAVLPPGITRVHSWNEIIEKIASSKV